MLTKHHVYVEIVKDITPRNLKRKTLYQDNTKTKKITNTKYMGEVILKIASSLCPASHY
jgi:hypothetical protein